MYLSQSGVVELTPNTALVGHDGWADGRLGDLDRSQVILKDFLLIDELRCWRDAHTLNKPALRQALVMLGDEAAGDVLLEAAQAHLGCQILVLCGHTHGGGELQVAENLRVLTGAAEYGKPEIQQIINVE